MTVSNFYNPKVNFDHFEHQVVVGDVLSLEGKKSDGDLQTQLKVILFINLLKTHILKQYDYYLKAYLNYCT